MGDDLNDNGLITRTGRPKRRSATVCIGAIAVITALVATACTGPSGTTPSAANPSPTATASPSASPTASAQSDATTVQAVVRKANDEQQQAFAQKNPTLMKDTATAAYYAQLVQVEATLRSAGVTAIQMLSMSFGQSTVQGRSAQVATTETWRATYADGTTTDDTSLNHYSLV